MNNALQQYIDLVVEHRNLIDSHSATFLNELRSKALDVIERINQQGLPEKGSEDYTLTDLDKILAPDYGLNLSRIKMDANPAAAFRCDVPAVSTDLCFLINDTFAKSEKSLRNLPEDVYVGDIAHSPADIIGKIGSVADLNNPIVALNTLLCQDGIVIYVPKHIHLVKPLQLVNLLSAGAPYMAVRRVLIVIGDDAQAQMLACDHTQTSDIDFLTLQTVEIILGENARFSYYDLEESSTTTNRLCSLYAHQAAGSKLTVNGMTLYNGFTRNEYFIRLQGENCETHLLGMGIADKERNIDVISLIDHAVPHCQSNELFKFSADDNAKCSFAGRILVRPGAHHTDSYQSNRNLLGSEDARIYSKPQLEIYNDEVKCSHGSATGQLDQLQLFYMRTRGIDEPTAKLLLKQAFMADIIDSAEMPGLRERLHHLVERRFSGETGACLQCNGGNLNGPHI